jgi:uroporphyrin-III C-methyltransferase/precorrin-2 dehydrogenase/sirohydrochlorin ferrochelatase
VPVNVIDSRRFDFAFGAIVNRRRFIGISTDGAAPVFGMAVRAKIRALIRAALRAQAEARGTRAVLDRVSTRPAGGLADLRELCGDPSRSRADQRISTASWPRPWTDRRRQRLALVAPPGDPNC